MKLPTKLPSLKKTDGTLQTILTSKSSLKNYRRVFYNQTLPLLEYFANNSTKILLYLLYNADSNNMIFCTYDDIMEDCNIKDKSLVAKVLKELLASEAIVKITTSHYMLNPALSVQGNNQKFGMLASEFNYYAWENKQLYQKKGNQ